MQLYDTARRAIVAFEPNDHVLMYTCGITPYDATHLGHAATFVAYDVLQRRLIDMGHTVRCVRNVTDVDDPLFAKARELGVHYLDLAAGEEARFERDMEALNALPVAASPRASSAIPDIRGFIGMVLDRGFAYEAGGSVYFDVSKFGSFGTLSHYTEEEMLLLAKERGGNIDDPNKRSPLDFVLWHPSAADEPSWDTMWGQGRPGWHIECSALALRELGTTIDLHGGGADLIFPHHECERAQSEAATGEPFVKHWMHTALISMDGEKMSKSLGNLVFVDKLRETWDPRAIRLAIIEHNYRTEWEWDDDLMPRNGARLAAWNGHGGSNPELLDVVRERLDDDLDTPGAITAIDAAAAVRRRRRRGGLAARHRPRLKKFEVGVTRDALTLLPTRTVDTKFTSWSSIARLCGLLCGHEFGARGRGCAARVRRVGRPVADRLWNIERSGYERLPDVGPAILCPNHVSFLDSAFLMLTVPRNISFVGKAEYMDSWKTKYLFPAMGMIPIDRSGGEKSTAALDARRSGAASEASSSASSPKGHGAAAVSSSRAARAPPVWR